MVFFQILPLGEAGTLDFVPVNIKQAWIPAVFIGYIGLNVRKAQKALKQSIKHPK